MRAPAAGVVALLALVAAAGAGTAPASGAPEREERTGPDAQAVATALRSARVGQALARIAHADPLGLGRAARAALDWSAGRTPLAIAASKGGWRLEAAGDRPGTLPLSDDLGRAISRVTDLIQLAEEAREHPVTTADLRAALSSPAGITVVRTLFDRCLDARLQAKDGPVFLELGGDAFLGESGPDLRTFDEPTRPALAALSARRDDPLAVGRLFQEQPAAMALVDESGQLEREVALWKQRTEKGVPEERRRHVFDLAVDTALRNAADAVILDPKGQLEAAIRNPPSGRLVGLWHLHPPAWKAGGLAPGDGPSPDDLQVAASTGRFVTVVFRPDGFDVHDLVARAGVVGENAAHFEVRPEGWHEHFAQRHAALAGGATAPPQ